MKTPPTIKPYTSQNKRPLWSVMIPVYNCAHLLQKALDSVLMQDPGADSMQIEVVDDASDDDDIRAMVEKIGKGRIDYFRQPQNVGSLRNFETCINRSRGHLVHLLHGDDRLRKGYYEKIGSLFGQYPHVGAAFCNYDFIDEKGQIMWENDGGIKEEGVLQNWLKQIASKQMLQYCTITIKREVYEKLGGYYGVNYGEDWEMWTRIAASYEMAYTPEILAEYRMHQGSLSHHSFKSAQNIRDIEWVIDTIQKMVPENDRDWIKKAAQKNYAYYALTIANSLWHQTGNKKITKMQVKGALKLHTDYDMLLQVAKIYTKMLIGRTGIWIYLICKIISDFEQPFRATNHVFLNLPC